MKYQKLKNEKSKTNKKSFCFVFVFTHLQAAAVKQKNSRVRRINEIFNGIKILKMYAWEPRFQELMIEEREEEVIFLQKTTTKNVSDFKIGRNTIGNTFNFQLILF